MSTKLSDKRDTKSKTIGTSKMKIPTFTRNMQRARPQMLDGDRAPSSWHDPIPSTGSISRVDVKFAARLPEAAQRILRDLADEADEMNVLSHAQHLRREEIRDAQARAAAKIYELEHPISSYRGNSAAAIEDQKGIIGACKADLDRLGQRIETDGVFHRLIESARDLVRRVDRDKPITAYSGSAPQLRKNETAAEAVEARRRRLRELQADFSRTEVAPKLSADMKSQEIARIEALAKQGTPSAFATIERGEAIIWPTTTAELIDHSGGVSVPDFLAIIAHLHRDAMIAAVSREIDLMADDANALSDADRAKALIQIKRDMLAVEREEVSFVHAANSQGANLLYRPETDSRALLGLGDDMPAPRRD
jgi:hypothetical protein